LLPDILWREMQVDHGGLNLRMPHEVHQRRQANTCPWSFYIFPLECFRFL
jgi:hypothetical protein